MARHSFVVAADVRSWHEFFVNDLTPDEVEVLAGGGMEAVRLAQEMEDAGRLELGEVTYEEGPPIFDEDASNPDVVEFEKEEG